MHILFVEDSYDAGLLSSPLKKKGHEVFRATNVAEAIDALDDEENAHFDAAIVDLDMNKYYLPPELHNEAENQYAGWVFYLHYLKTHPVLKNHTLILSALLFNFPLSDRDVDVKYIDKRDNDYIDQVIDWLNEMNNPKG